jgi:hypothetical protein
MSTKSLFYLGFINEASHHTQKLASVAWVVYSHDDLLVSGVCLGPSTNNVVEYNIVIELLRDTI